jgi:dipeptidyl aminopeptidase/acylaminoacyl peptidase
MEAALQKAGKSAQLVEIDGAEHWLLSSHARIALLEAAVGFVEKYDPAD